MSPKRLTKLKRQIENLRRRKANIRSGELVAIAKALGRRKHKRGKEPTYISDKAGWLPLSIPNHPGAMAVGTACNILNQLEDDALKWEEELDELAEDEDQVQDDLEDNDD